MSRWVTFIFILYMFLWITFIYYILFYFWILFFFLNFCLGSIFSFSMGFWFRICFSTWRRIYILILIYFYICIRFSFIYLFWFSVRNWFYILRNRNLISKIWFSIIIFLIFYAIIRLCFNIYNLFIAVLRILNWFLFTIWQSSTWNNIIYWLAYISAFTKRQNSYVNCKINFHFIIYIF